MKVKVDFIDKGLQKEWFGVLTAISTISSLILIGIEIPADMKILTGICLLVFFILIYFYLWYKANTLTRTTIKINNSILDVKIGNIMEEPGLKVIAFNEYFDTLVDNRVIAEQTLNGQFIKNCVDDIVKFDELIDSGLKTKVIEECLTRSIGKKKKYNLGTIYQHDNYLLTAFTKFDDNNRAYLTMGDYISFLLNFWNEIDICYAGRSVSIPLLGSGITRFKGYDMISEQELLELLIWSFKISRIKFTYPSRVSIIIHESKKDKINFYKIKECGC